MRKRLSVLCRINHIFAAVILLLAVQAAQGRHRFNIYLNGEPNEPASLLYCPPEEDRGTDMLNWADYYLTYKEHFPQRGQEEDCGFLTAGESDDVWVYNDITTNQVWTADKVYIVDNGVNVQALLVIEPGTVIYFTEYGCLFVNNGGTLISCGTPDKPIIYSSFYAQPSFGDYYCAIYIEETASPASIITYSYVEFAETAIVTDNIKLDKPIENNYLFYNITGIKVYPYPLSRQKIDVFKMDSSPYVKAVGTQGARRATGVPTATPYTSAGVR